MEIKRNWKKKKKGIAQKINQIRLGLSKLRKIEVKQYS